jgi:hypothetical protein
MHAPARKGTLMVANENDFTEEKCNFDMRANSMWRSDMFSISPVRTVRAIHRWPDNLDLVAFCLQSHDAWLVERRS